MRRWAAASSRSTMAATAFSCWCPRPRPPPSASRPCPAPAAWREARGSRLWHSSAGHGQPLPRQCPASPSPSPPARASARPRGAPARWPGIPARSPPPRPLPWAAAHPGGVRFSWPPRRVATTERLVPNRLARHGGILVEKQGRRGAETFLSNLGQTYSHQHWCHPWVRLERIRKR
jgi:hypothetical protein